MWSFIICKSSSNTAKIRGAIQSSRNVSEKQVDTLKVLIATIPSKVVPNVSATTGSCPGSPFVSASSVPSAIRLGFPLWCQIFALST